MVYTYEAFSSGEADDGLWNKVKNALNGLSEDQAMSVKIASSDQKSNDARSVIYFTDSPAPSPDTLGSQWSYEVFSTGSDYNGMYAACADFLNGDTLTDTQKYYSKVSMTNAHDNDSHIVLWYRDQN